MVDKSSIPLNHGFPNPFFGGMHSLVSMQPEIKSLIKLVQSQEGDFAKVFESLSSTDFERRLRVVFDSVRSMPRNEPVIGPAPRPNQLYGRFGRGTAIFDIGSGNCSKLVPFSGSLKITANDLDGAMPKLKHVMNWAVGTFSAHIPRPYELFTSFMSLTNLTLGELQYVQSSDGMHVIPYHDRLIEQGCATVLDDELVEVKAPGRIFRDRRLHMAGYELTAGYKLVVTYKEENFMVEISSDTKKDVYEFHLDATPSGIDDINLDDVSWKYDGVPYELECKDGVAFMTSRNGFVQIGTTTFDDHMCLHVEHVRGYGLILLRVVAYRGMIPPHCLDCLALFCEKKKIIVDFSGELCHLKAPDKWIMGGVAPCAVDGLISRVDERDFYFKPGWTVDLYPDGILKLKDKLDAKGYRLHVPEQGTGLCQYLLSRDGAQVSLTFERERFDKNEPTTLDTVMYLMDRKTLSEMQFLDGTNWKQN